MTLLTICTDAADEIGIDRPSSVIGNPQPAIQKLLRYANKVGNRLMKAVDWQILRKEKTFTSIVGETQTGILPADFDRFVAEAFWDRSASKLISGPVSSVEWQSMKATAYNQDPKFAYRGGSVLILPVYGAGSTLAFEYVSKNWCQSSGGTGQSAWAADTDLPVLDAEMMTLGLKVVYLTDEGLPNAIAMKDFDDYFATLLGNDQPSAGILSAADIFGGGRHFGGTPSVNGGPLTLS
jgi:hypothetical protein